MFIAGFSLKMDALTADISPDLAYLETAVIAFEVARDCRFEWLASLPEVIFARPAVGSNNASEPASLCVNIAEAAPPL